MADIRELVPTFLESLSHNALCHNRKRETLDACIQTSLHLKNNLNFLWCLANSPLDVANAFLLCNFDSIGSINIFNFGMAFAVPVSIEFSVAEFR